jgi:hypothetical protein
MHTRQGAADPRSPKNNVDQAIQQVRQLLAPNWKPLEKLLPQTECANFMFMGDVAGIHLYKHIETRRYLNIDEAGATYVFNPKTSNYDPIPLAQAIERVRR